MAETSKARLRRSADGWNDRYIVSPGIDIGSGPDPLNDSFRRWDKPDGDATHMAGIADGTFATVYASHILEHLDDPLAALRNWWRILAPGGHLIVLVPHRDLYEKQRMLPSRWNGEHKTFWLPDRFDPPVTWSFRWAIEQCTPEGELVSFSMLDEGYESNGSAHPAGELSIEAIIRKPIADVGPSAILSDSSFQADIQLREWINRSQGVFSGWRVSGIDVGQATIDRNIGFWKVLNRLSKVSGPTIVETGTLRDPQAWAGDGCSTLIFGLFVSHHGGQLHSIDSNMRSVEIANAACRHWPRVQIHHGDSIEWLRRFNGEIVALYLDSSDTDVPGHAEHCLEEAKAAEPKIAPDGMMIIDDTISLGGRLLGKGSLAVPWLMSRGWRVVHQGYQVILEKA